LVSARKLRTRSMMKSKACFPRCLSVKQCVDLLLMDLSVRLRKAWLIEKSGIRKFWISFLMRDLFFGLIKLYQRGNEATNVEAMQTFPF
jgi:hypothetical protein